MPCESVHYPCACFTARHCRLSVCDSRRYRTTNGVMGSATSADGIAWIGGLFARHDPVDYGAGLYLGKVKQPTGPTTPRRFRNGMFLMTVFADQQVYPDMYGFNKRNPYWVVPGWERDGEAEVLWGQPEVLLYTLPPCEDPKCGIGYPDFIEVADGRVFITETDKVNSRVHPLPSAWLDLVWQQDTIATVASGGLILNRQFTHSTGPIIIPAPTWGQLNLSAGAGFAIEVEFDAQTLPNTEIHGLPLFDCRHTAKMDAVPVNSGIVVLFTKVAAIHVVNISMWDGGGGQGQSWDTDSEARLWLPQKHTVLLNVDGLARTITTVVNGVFGSGGSRRPQGWTALDPKLGAVGGASAPHCTVHSSVSSVRVYDRYLTTTEAIGNWRSS
jgi:hypothetical protein